ncbi:MAG: kelch repeat-containing protein [Candidatus Binatus sp.]|jgi:hypothetical protein|uniref:kelch repeat-containing protein n=1 Tax=Candidatus Binatus sp. TaxID=2811406 RepID=UPI003C989811
MNLISSSNMNTPRTQFSATRLGGSGKILIVGGLDADGNPLASAELYDPSTGVFTTIAGALNTARYGHVGVATVGGAIFIIGGQGAGGGYLASVEMFGSGSGRPEVTGTFTTASNGLSSARANMAAELQANGEILIVGGADSGDAALALAEVYAPGI